MSILVQVLGSSGFFLTAFHVVSSARQSGDLIRLRRGRTLPFNAEIVEIDESRDIALLVATLPVGIILRPAPIATVSDVGRLTVLQMLDPAQGIVAPLPVAVPSVGETAVSYKFGGRERIIENVWSQQGLTIPGGISGAPVVSDQDDAVVAVAAAGADVLTQAFFIPLATARPKPSHRRIADAIVIAKEGSTRLGRFPNERGISVRCWLYTKSSIQSLSISGVYEKASAVYRPLLWAAVDGFLRSDTSVAILAGTSGVGKSASLAHLVSTHTVRGPVLLLRAAKLTVTGRNIDTALPSALGLQDVTALEHLSDAPMAAPLIIIDGINELPISRDEWPHFVEIGLLNFVNIIKRKYWKLLITTRTDRLDDLGQLQQAVQLYTTQDQSTQEERPKVPCVRLESFERQEFDQLLRLHNLPATLPFPELRHPIVFRLMLADSKEGKVAAGRIRTLFEQYYTRMVIGIHIRCSTRSRDRIATLLETLTALDKTVRLGYISSAAMTDVNEEAIVEAAVSEGLLERVVGGYRYVYDELFDFVLAKSLVVTFKQLFRDTVASAIEIVDLCIKTGATFGAVARTLELLSDQDPEAFAIASQLIADEMKLRNRVDTAEAGYMIPIMRLRNIIQVLSRVEKGGALDRAKDVSPLLGIRTASGGIIKSDTMNPHLFLSDDHISYAFDDGRMWRMVRLSARSNPDRDSWPFRLRDIKDDSAHEFARELFQFEQYKVLHHMMTGFPDHTLGHLLAGLDDDESFGREHSFGSFCAQAIAVYSDKFAFDVIFDRLVKCRSHKAIEVLKRLCRAHVDETLMRYLTQHTDLISKPDLAATILCELIDTLPNRQNQLIKVSIDLVVRHQHSLSLYAPFFTLWAAAPERDDLSARFRQAWSSGAATDNDMLRAAESGLLPFDDVFNVLVGRLPRASDKNASWISNWDAYLFEPIDSSERLNKIDKIIDALLEGCEETTDALISQTEHLLYQTFPAKTVSNKLRSLVEQNCKERPKRAANCLIYPMANHNFDHLEEYVQRDLCNIVTLFFGFDEIIETLELCMERTLASFKTKYLAQRIVERYGAQALFEEVKDRYFDSSMGNVPKVGETFVKMLEEIEPITFELYRGSLMYKP
jgi:hypothetical protein